jgi:hypothetical protein
MKLYMECELKNLAIKKWGSLERLALEIEERAKSKLKKRARAAEKKSKERILNAPFSILIFISLQTKLSVPLRRLKVIL